MVSKAYETPPCPHCGHLVFIREPQDGKHIDCGSCRASLLVCYDSDLQAFFLAPRIQAEDTDAENS